MSAPEAKRGAKDLAFELTFENAIIGRSMDNRISSMSDTEKEEWIVKGIDPASGGARKAQALLICIGERQVPDIVGESLTDALKTLKESDFSNAKYKASDGSSIWDTDNWMVISQNIEPGETINANDDITLTVRSYKDIEEEQIHAGGVEDTSEGNDNDTADNVSSVSISRENLIDETQDIDDKKEENDVFETESSTSFETDVTSEDFDVVEPENAEKPVTLKEDAAEAPSDSDEPVEAPGNPEEAAEEPVTPDYETEMLEMLSAEQDIESVSKGFAEKYAGVEIRFDGNVAFIDDTNDKILIHSGNYTDETIKGPDILLEGYKEGNLEVGDQLSITATVKTYDEATKMLIVTPGSVSVLSHSDVLVPNYNSNEIVRLVQTRLNEEGFECGAVDGLAGQKTHSQIQAFKKTRGLNANDSIDAELLAFLRVSPNAIAQAVPAPTPEPKEQKVANIVTQAPFKPLEEKLDPIYAWQALEQYGEYEYPFGFKLHYIVGQIAQRQYDADTWFLKAECTIENMFGNKYKTVCEGRVTGTTDNPQVVYFWVYD